ncbi:MAG: RNA-guided endonuclease TnpB family protein [Clostridium sp.]
MITVRKLKLYICGDDKELIKKQYKFIRDSQYAQYCGLNTCMGYLIAGYYSNNRDIKSANFKEWQKGVANSADFFSDINFGTGIDSKSMITQKVKKDFSTALKNGLAKGERNVTNYKRTFPLMTRGRDLKFFYKEDDVCIKWVNKITFKVLLGTKKCSNLELRHTIHKIINGEYKIGQSSLEFNKNNKLILNLTLDIPEKKNIEIIKDRVCGVDLGIAIPAYCSIGDAYYIRKGFGSANELVKVRKQFRNRQRRLQNQLQLAKGGKGRKDKLKSLLSEKESNFAQTYNHSISKNIVDFAKKNKCEFINMEALEGTNFEEKLLSIWGYYQLREQVIYKAEREGIKVRLVNPAYTSQRCSKCGYIDKENRPSQANFECKSCGLKINADYNASQNIAHSTEFIEKRKK